MQKTSGVYNSSQIIVSEITPIQIGDISYRTVVNFNGVPVSRFGHVAVVFDTPTPEIMIFGGIQTFSFASRSIFSGIPTTRDFSHDTFFLSYLSDVWKYSILNNEWVEFFDPGSYITIHETDLTA